MSKKSKKALKQRVKELERRVDELEQRPQIVLTPPETPKTNYPTITWPKVTWIGDDLPYWHPDYPYKVTCSSHNWR